jgi:hypothetical protein
MSKEQSGQVVVRMEVIVPQVAGAESARPLRQVFGNTPRIIRPQTGNPSWRARNDQFICATGDNAIEVVNGTTKRAVNVLAHAYPGDVPLNQIPDNPLNVTPIVGVGPTDDVQGSWSFGDANPIEISIPQLGQNTLAIWAVYSDNTTQKTRTLFMAVSSDRTECFPGGYYFGKSFTSPASPAALAYRWKFTLTGVRNLKCTNCGALNKTWVLELDVAQAAVCRWLAVVPQSFANPETHAWWRLQKCPGSGYWYLDCVQHPDMPLGVWISYRCHESRWKPNGANRMTLHTNSSYCDVPAELTIEAV